jgi:hypothetical protein
MELMPQRRGFDHHPLLGQALAQFGQGQVHPLSKPSPNAPFQVGDARPPVAAQLARTTLAVAFIAVFDLVDPAHTYV